MRQFTSGFGSRWASAEEKPCPVCNGVSWSHVRCFGKMPKYKKCERCGAVFTKDGPRVVGTGRR